jgi:DNA-binding IclR family transcriptional regulator
MLHKAMEVLSLFSPSRRDLGVVEAAELLKRPKSTVSRWLSAMEDAGFLHRDDDTGRYRVSMLLAALGEHARQATSIQRMARPALQRLTAATGETSDLVVLIGSDAVNVEVVESPRPIMHVGWVGRRLPLHASAAGKSLLAWRSEDDIRALLQLPLTRFTAATVTDLDTLLKELARVRDDGYSVAWAELEDDMVGVASPVRDHRGQVAGALAIGAPISRVPKDALPTVAAHVMEAAQMLSTDLGYQDALHRPIRNGATAS